MDSNLSVVIFSYLNLPSNNEIIERVFGVDLMDAFPLKSSIKDSWRCQRELYRRHIQREASTFSIEDKFKYILQFIVTVVGFLWVHPEHRPNSLTPPTSPVAEHTGEVMDVYFQKWFLEYSHEKENVLHDIYQFTQSLHMTSIQGMFHHDRAVVVRELLYTIRSGVEFTEVSLLPLVLLMCIPLCAELEDTEASRKQIDQIVTQLIACIPNPTDIVSIHMSLDKIMAFVNTLQYGHARP